MFQGQGRRIPPRQWRPCPPDQVGNGHDDLVDLTPVSQSPADATRAGWAPLLTGQAIPRIGERVQPDDICRDE